MKRSFLWFLAFLGAADCVLIPFFFSASIQQPLFPLPGLYFIEIALLGLMGLVSAVRDQTESLPWWNIVPWMAAGVLLAFNILGALTIGFFLIPGTLSLFGVGLILVDRNKKEILKGLGSFLIAAIVQGGLMLALIQIF